MTSSSVTTDQESSPALQLNWKILGDKKFALIHKFFTTNEAKDCWRLNRLPQGNFLTPRRQAATYLLQIAFHSDLNSLRLA